MASTRSESDQAERSPLFSSAKKADEDQERPQSMRRLYPLLFAALVLFLMAGLVAVCGWIVFHKLEKTQEVPAKDIKHGYWNDPTPQQLISHQTPPSNQTRPVNVNLKLKELTDILERSINKAVDPCEDFFKYSCGKLLEENEIEPDRSSFSTLTKILNKIEGRMQKLLESEVHFDLPAIKKLRISYKKCMDKTSYESLALQATLDWINKVGYFPLFESNDEWQNLTWADVVSHMARNDIGPAIFRVNLDWDARNHSRRIVTFSEPELSNLEYWSDPEKYASIMEVIRNISIQRMQLFMEEVNLTPKATFLTELDEVYRFNLRLAAIQPASHEMTPMWKRYQLENFINFSKRFENRTRLSLREYMAIGVPDAVRQIIYDEDILVYVKEPNYLEKLFKLIKETPTNVLMNFYMVANMNRYWAYFPAKFEVVDAPMTRILSGTEKPLSQTRKCLLLMGRFSEAYAALYVWNHFNAMETKQPIVEMVNSLKTAFVEIVTNADWMDEATKKEAKKKVNEMQLNFAYKPEEMNETLLNEVYNTLNIKEEMNFIQIDDEFFRWKRERSYKKLMLPFRRDFFFQSTSVNAAYLSSQNVISFPAGILQPPFYDPDYLKAWNFGLLGSVIGHEITHGFDNSGRHFDELGQLREWWSAETSANYRNKATCIQRQYDELSWEDMKLNGRQTLSENIADHGGVRESFLAYMNYLRANRDQEEALPGEWSHLTEEQIFFIGYSQFWCQKSRPEYERQMILSDSHSLPVFRVNTVLGNQPEFQRAFNCLKGSPMAPVERCTLW